MAGQWDPGILQSLSLPSTRITIVRTTPAFVFLCCCGFWVWKSSAKLSPKPVLRESYFLLGTNGKLARVFLWTCCYELVTYTISPKTRRLLELSVKDEGDGHDWYAFLWAWRERMKYGWAAWSFCLVIGDVSLSTPQSSVCAGWSPRGLQWIRTTDEVWTVSEHAQSRKQKPFNLFFPLCQNQIFRPLRETT